MTRKPSVKFIEADIVFVVRIKAMDRFFQHIVVNFRSIRGKSSNGTSDALIPSFRRSFAILREGLILSFLVG